METNNQANSSNGVLNLSSGSNAQMSISDDEQPADECQLDAPGRARWHLRLPLPSEHYADCVMRAIGVDPPFMDTKNRKTTIRREMFSEVLSDGKTYVNIILSCDGKDPQEVASLRTCASSSLTNLMLVCETIKEFGE